MTLTWWRPTHDLTETELKASGGFHRPGGWEAKTNTFGADFDEDAHPRDAAGRFAPADGEFGTHAEVLAEALHHWKGDPTSIQFHMTDILNGEPEPSSKSGRHMRAWAEAVSHELATNAIPAPRTLYRGAHRDPATLALPSGWTTSKSVATKMAGKTGDVYEAPKGTMGIRIADYIDDELDGYEKEWIVAPEALRPALRAAGDFDESLHPRDEKGRFGEKDDGDVPTTAGMADIPATADKAQRDASIDEGNRWAAEHPTEAQTIRDWLNNGRLSTTEEQRTMLSGMIAASPPAATEMFRGVVLAEIPIVGQTIEDKVASWSSQETVAQFVADRRNESETWAKQTGLAPGDGHVVVFRSAAGDGNAMYVSALSGVRHDGTVKGGGPLAVAGEHLRDSSWRVTAVSEPVLVHRISIGGPGEGFKRSEERDYVKNPWTRAEPSSDRPSTVIYADVEEIR